MCNIDFLFRVMMCAAPDNGGQCSTYKIQHPTKIKKNTKKYSLDVVKVDGRISKLQILPTTAILALVSDMLYFGAFTMTFKISKLYLLVKSNLKWVITYCLFDLIPMAVTVWAEHIISLEKASPPDPTPLLKPPRSPHTQTSDSHIKIWRGLLG
jgi:hypothetical protein